MKVLSILTLAVTFTVTKAWTIPSDIAPGHYTIKLDDNIVSPHFSGNMTNTTISKRDSFPGYVEVGCANSILDGCPEHSAWQGLVGWCEGGGGVKGRSITTWIDGNSVWYVCSYGGYQPCGFQEVLDASNRLNGACGTLRSGYVWINDWAKTYGRARRGDSICGNL